MGLAITLPARSSSTFHSYRRRGTINYLPTYLAEKGGVSLTIPVPPAWGSSKSGLKAVYKLRCYPTEARISFVETYWSFHVGLGGPSFLCDAGIHQCLLTPLKSHFIGYIKTKPKLMSLYKSTTLLLPLNCLIHIQNTIYQTGW